jgi:hypothetical protein
MAWLQTALATGVLLVCVALLVRMAMSPRWRARLDAHARSVWARLRVWGRVFGRSLGRASGGWRTRRKGQARAEAEAREAIERAMGAARREALGKVEREGNVYTPEAFGKRRPGRDPKKLH